MGNKMKVYVRVHEDRLNVRCELSFSQKIQSFKFSLNRQLLIKCISSEKQSIDWSENKTYCPTFRAEAYEVEVKHESNQAPIVIEYEGSIDGWCNVLSDSLKAFNFYSVWYPQECSEPLDKIEIFLENFEDYHVLKATFNHETKLWHYNGDKFDPGNIIAFKKGCYHQMDCGSLSAYYLNLKEKPLIQELVTYYEEVINYYTQVLYDSKPINQLEFVSLGLENNQGAYFRDELIVSTTLLDETLDEAALKIKLGWLMVHELAHHWCEGADTNSYEDWLNETTAEWSALVYAKECHHEELFEFILAPKLAEYMQLPPIKTSDGSRPDGVHTKGTVLFYLIYKQYGLNVVKQLLQLFVQLPCKDTNTFLNEIKKQISLEVAQLIEVNLERQHFDV